jgi:hypothetical protein
MLAKRSLERTSQVWVGQFASACKHKRTAIGCPFHDVTASLDAVPDLVMVIGEVMAADSHHQNQCADH